MSPRRVASLVFAAVIGGASVPIAYQQVAGTTGVDELRVGSDARSRIVHLASSYKSMGMRRPAALSRLVDVTGYPARRIRPILERAYAGGDLRDIEARNSRNIGMLVRRSETAAAEAAVLGAWCGDLAGVEDAGPTPEETTCLANNAGWFGQRYCRTSDGLHRWNAARWWATEHRYRRVANATYPASVALVEPATDAAWDAELAARNLIDCDDVTDGGP